MPRYLQAFIPFLHKYYFSAIFNRLINISTRILMINVSINAFRNFILSILQMFVPLACFLYLESDFNVPEIIPSTVFNRKLYEELLPHFMAALQSYNQSTITHQSLTNMLAILSATPAK
jgi:hypothetical protein